MSERQKTRLLAVYLILVNAGIRISESMQQAVNRIEQERAAAIVARVQ